MFRFRPRLQGAPRFLAGLVTGLLIGAATPTRGPAQAAPACVPVRVDSAAWAARQEQLLACVAPQAPMPVRALQLDLQRQAGVAQLFVRPAAAGDRVRVRLPLRAGAAQVEQLTPTGARPMAGRAALPVRLTQRASRDGRMVRLELAIAAGFDVDSLVIPGRPTWTPTPAQRAAWVSGAPATAPSAGAARLDRAGRPDAMARSSAGCADVRDLAPTTPGAGLGLRVAACVNPIGVTALQVAWPDLPAPAGGATAGAGTTSGAGCIPGRACVDLVLAHGDSISQWRLLVAPDGLTPAWFRRPTPTGEWVAQPTGPTPVSRVLARYVATAPGHRPWGLELALAPGWRLSRLQSRGPVTGAPAASPTVWLLEGLTPRPAAPAPSSAPPDPAPRLEAAAPDGRAGGAPPPRRPRMLWLDVLAASPMPLTAERQGRVAWGVQADLPVGAWRIVAAVRPPAVVPPLLPLVAEPNRRVPRLIPEGRVDLLPWRVSPGSYLWMDTWRVDRSLASVDLQRVDGRARAALFAGDRGLSAWATSLTSRHVGLLVGAMADGQTPTAVGTLHPWAGAATLTTAWGAPWALDSTTGEHPRDTLQQALRPLPLSWRARTAVTYAGRLGLSAGGRSTGRAEGEWPLGGTHVLQLVHERLPQGLNAAGMVRAPWEGLTRTDLTVRHLDLTHPLQWDVRVTHVELLRGTQWWDRARSPGRELGLQPSLTWARGGTVARATAGAQWFAWPGLDPRPRPMARVSLQQQTRRGGEIWAAAAADAFPLFLRGGAPGRQGSAQIWWREPMQRRAATWRWTLEGGLAGGLSAQCGPTPVGAVLLTPSGLLEGAAPGAGADVPTLWTQGCATVQRVWGWGLGTVLATRTLQLTGQWLAVSDQWRALTPTPVVALQPDPLQPGWRLSLEAQTPWGRWRVSGACWQGLTAGPCAATTGLTVPLARGGRT